MLEVENKDFIRNPYPFYRRLQEQQNLYFKPGDGEGEPDCWYVSDYDEVVRILKDRRFGREMADERPPGPSKEQQMLAGMNTGVMLHRDPPDHTRLRRLVSKAFTPARVKHLRADVERFCDELLDAAADKRDVDWIADFAMPLPVMVISDMLGVPKEDRHLVKEWSHALARTLEPGSTSMDDTEGIQAAMAFAQYLQGIFDERKREPKDDLMTALLQAEEAGDQLNEGERYATCILLLAAGHETTTNLIGNGLYTLWRHPDSLAQLRQDPDLTPGAVEEMLRYESPIQRTARYAHEDLELRGANVKKGQRVYTLLAAANRDPAQFSNPDTFDIRRKPNRHVAFGMGVHFCLGAPLARLEGDVAFRKLLSRFPHMDVDVSRPEWHEMVVFRGLKQLPGRVR